jgi:energy-coupling factor transporter ATP-binding protein EcfA2
MRIEITRDAKTGFPCLRCKGGSDFTAMLPVTKLQAEEWIWREGLGDCDGVALLVEQLGVHRAGDQFPAAVHKLERRPIGRLETETVLSVVASNLSLWTSPEETWASRGTFPTSTSEWGRLLRWLGGRVPQYDEWLRTQDSFVQVQTEDLLHQVLKLRHAWPPAVERLLWKLRELVPRGARGLPFMGRGLYELIAETEQVERLVHGPRKEVRPQVAGDSSVWPLDIAVSTGWRSLRSARFPVVAIRPWFSERDIVAPTSTVGFDTLELAIQRSASRSPLAAGWRTAVRRVPLKPYVKAGDQMRNRCPQCHQLVDKATFAAPFDCFETRVEVKQQDGSIMVEKKREHKFMMSHVGTTITRSYIDRVRAHPENIHTVALAGYTAAGKTTFLLSLGGLMDYPDGSSAIFKPFPSSWKFVKQPLTIYNVATGGGHIDRRKATEEMWLDGVLPTRTSDTFTATRDQVLFRSKPTWRGTREIVLLLDDMAGEAISKPKMVTNENYPHFASIADVIYIVPADNMSAASAIMTEFANRLEQAQAEGVPIDLKRTNLIFVVSKIDQLRNGSPAQQDLFERILPHPYRLPQDSDCAELKAYLEEMEEVHYAIESWIRKHKPEFFTFFDLFGSVRCCGLSASGFEPISGGVGGVGESTLAFRPEPVRVVDPVFWLLKENGLIDF